MSRTLETFLVPLDFVHAGPTGSSSAGESHHRESLFPPPASTWQGVLRTALLRAVPGLDLSSPSSRARIARLVGPPGSLPAEWSMEGPWPAQERDGALVPWLPVPAWLRLPEHGVGPPELARPAPVSGGDLLTGGTAAKRWEPWTTPHLGTGKAAVGWLPVTTLLDVLSGKVPANLQVPRTPPFVTEDVRPGVALHADGRPKDGMLYFLGGQRFTEGSGLYGGVTGPLPSEIPADALHRGRATLGRKGRPLALAEPPKLHAAWGKYTGGSWLPATLADGAYAWVGLSSPAFLTDDERAAPGFKAALPSSLVDVDIEVCSRLQEADIVRGALHVYAEGGPRLAPNRPWVPAGSGWLVRLHGGAPVQRVGVLRALHHRCLLGPLAERSFGAGRLYVGLVPPALAGA